MSTTETPELSSLSNEALLASYQNLCFAMCRSPEAIAEVRDELNQYGKELLRRLDKS